MTGIGSYFYIVWAIWLRHCLNEKQDEFILNWPNIFAVPEVIPISELDPSSANGIPGNDYTNGHVKGEERKSV